MTAAKITQLTPGQEKRLAACYSEWLAKGRACEPLDRDSATKIVAEFYQRIGKPAPRVLFFSSPLMCVLAYGVLRTLPGAKPIKGRLWGQLRGQLWGQLRGQLGDQLGDRLWDQLADRLWDRLGGQLGDQLGDRLWGQLAGQLRDRLGGQLGGQLWGQLAGQLRDQLGDRLWDQLRGQLGDQLGNCLAGQHWCAWEVFYAFCGEIGVRYTADQQALLDLWLRQSNGMHWWFPYDGIVLASERHTSVHVDDQGRLHHASELACGYSDGWGVYAWHGVRIPEQYFTKPVDAKAILAEQNTEIRRALIERYGEKEWMLAVGAKVIDSAVQAVPPALAQWLETTLGSAPKEQLINELLAIELPGDPEERMVALNVIDPSTGRRYIIRVPPDQKTVKDALAWTFDMSPHEYQLAMEA